MLLPNLLSEHQRWKHEAPVVVLVDPDRTSASPTPAASEYELADRPDVLPSIDVHLAATETDPDDTRAAVAGEDALWVATGGGLLRVPYADPEGAVHWTTADGLRDHRLTALAGDDSLLVAGTEAGTVLWLDPTAALDGTGAPRVTAYADVAKARISALQVDGGALYVGTHGEGIFVGDVADPRLFRPVGPAHGMRSRRITSLAMLDDELFAGTAGAGVWVRSADGKSRRYVAKGGLAGDFVLDLTVHDGRIVAATTGGISRYRRGSWQTDRSFEGKVPAGIVRAVGVDEGGVLTLSVSGGRVGRYGSGTAGALPPLADGLSPWHGAPRAEVRWMTVGGDRLFAGTERGLLQRRDGVWQWLLHSGPGNNDITSVAAAAGTVLVGTFDRGAWIRDPAFSSWAALPVPYGEVNGVHLDDGGRPWTATSAGLVRLDEEGPRSFTTLHGLKSDHVAAVRGADAGLWVGSTGGLQRFDGVGFTGPLGVTEDGGPSHIYDVAADGDDVWVGTLEGLWHVESSDAGTTTSRFRYATGELPDDWINAVAVGADGTVWAGTYDHGLAYRSPGGPWRRLAEPDDLPCGWVNPGAMASLPDGSVLVGTLGGGLLRVGTGGLIDHWTMTDGLAGDDVTSVAVDGETVHVGTRSGLSRLEIEPAVPALADRS